MLRDGMIASIRTGVAFFVTWLVTKALGIGAEIDTDTAAALNVALFGLGVVGYNFVVGQLERRVNPLFGILLGVPKAPQYGAVGTKTPSTNDGTVVAEGNANRVQNDRGAAEPTGLLLVLGLISFVIGLVLDLATRYHDWGFALMIVGGIVFVVGVVLALLGRSSGTRV